MDAPQVGKVHEHAAHLVDATGDVVVIHGALRFLHQEIDFFLGQAIDLTQFTEDGSVPEGGHGADEGRVSAPVAFEDIVQHLIPVLPGEVDVKVRGTGPFGIDETLEVEVQVNGIHIGDPQAVGHDGIGPAAPAHMVESPGTWNSGSRPR